MANSSYSYPHNFTFETSFDQWAVKRWTEDHWVSLCTTAGSLYVFLVFAGRAAMEGRPPFQLRGALTAWSAALATFSVLGLSRTLPELLHTLATGGLQESVCNPNYLETNTVSAFWTVAFIFSKLPELGDTAFIVLRKQKLIFLHWYHHLTVMCYGFYTYSVFPSTGRWFMVMNYCVHSIMYSYYALRAMRVKVPTGFAMMIMSLQLLQMVVGCAINLMALNYKSRGVACDVSQTNITWSLLMYFSYFLLFARFFQQAYFSGSGSKRSSDKKQN